jgi:Ca-activated chloride channel family protein
VVKFRSLTILITILAGLAATLAVSAKQDPPPQSSQQKPKPTSEQDPADSIRIDTELVQLDLRVFDKRLAPVYGLTKDDFTVLEDQVKQTIESVSSEEVPLSFGIAVDTSGSMRTRLQAIIEAAQVLIKQIRPEDEAFLVQFKTEVKLVQDFTADQKKLDDALGELYCSGGTALLDAIIETSTHAQLKGKRRRKALIVISDGLEKNSSARERAVLEAIKQNEVQVFLVGFLDDPDSGSPAARAQNRKGRDTLQSLAGDSGGRAFFPKDIDEMPAIAAQISKDLRTQYVLSYYPTNEKRDGTFRRVSVIARDRNGGKLTVNTRQGYYARPDRNRQNPPTN